MPSLQIGIDSRKAKKGSNDFVKATNAISANAAKADRIVKRMSNTTSKVGKPAGEAGKSINKFSEKVVQSDHAMKSHTGSMVAMMAAFAAITIVKEAIVAMAKFEETMLRVQGITSATDMQLAKLTNTARELGATTRFSAEEAGEGLLFLARAGFTTEQAIEALPDTLNLAVVGMIELGDAADIASNVLRQFSLSTSEVERVVDTLVNTANSANTDIKQLSEAMKFAGPIAGSLGLSVEETAASIGTLGNAGIQASLAGTNLRGILASLLDPSAGAEKALKKLGISMEDVNPENNNLISIFDEFANANLNASAAVEIFGRRNVSAALVLSQSADAIRDLTRANEEAEGVARRNAEIVDQGLVGAYKALISALGEVNLALADAGLNESLKDLTKSLTEIARDTGLWIKENENNIKVIGDVIKTGAKLVAVYASFKVLSKINVLMNKNSTGLVNIGKGAIAAAKDINILQANMLKVETRSAAFASITPTLTAAMGKLKSALTGTLGVVKNLAISYAVFKAIDLVASLLSARKAADDLNSTLGKLGITFDEVNKKLNDTKKEFDDLGDSPFIKFNPAAVVPFINALKELNEIQKVVNSSQREAENILPNVITSLNNLAKSTRRSAEQQQLSALESSALFAIMESGISTTEKNTLAFSATESSLLSLAKSAELTNEELLALASRQDDINRATGRGSTQIEKNIIENIRLNEVVKETTATFKDRINRERELTEFTKLFAKERADAIKKEVEITREAIGKLISEFDKLNKSTISPQEGLLDLQDKAIKDLDNQAKLILDQISKADTLVGSLLKQDFSKLTAGDIPAIRLIIKEDEFQESFNSSIKKLNDIAAEKIKIDEVIKAQLFAASQEKLQIKAVTADQPIMQKSEDISSEGIENLNSAAEAAVNSANLLIEKQLRLNEITSSEGAVEKAEAKQEALDQEVAGIDLLIEKQRELQDAAGTFEGKDAVQENINELLKAQNEIKIKGLEVDKQISLIAEGDAIKKQESLQNDLVNLEEFLIAKTDMIELAKLDEIERITELESQAREIELEKQAERQELLRVALENGLLTKEEFLALELELQAAHQGTLTKISKQGDADRLQSRVKSLQSGLGATQDILSSINNLSKAFGSKNLEDNKVFGAIQIATSTAIGVTKALELLPNVPAAAAAGALAITTGIAQLANLKSGKVGGGPSSIGNPSGGSANSPGGSVGNGQEVQLNKRQLSIIVRGDENSVSNSTRDLLRAQADEINNGGADTVDLTFESN